MADPSLIETDRRLSEKPTKLESNLGLEVHLTSRISLSCDETKIGRIKILVTEDVVRMIQEIDSCCF